MLDLYIDAGSDWATVAAAAGAGIPPAESASPPARPARPDIRYSGRTAMGN